MENSKNFMLKLLSVTAAGAVGYLASESKNLKFDTTLLTWLIVGTVCSGVIWAINQRSQAQRQADELNRRLSKMEAAIDLTLRSQKALFKARLRKDSREYQDKGEITQAEYESTVELLEMYHTLPGKNGLTDEAVETLKDLPRRV